MYVNASVPLDYIDRAIQAGPDYVRPILLAAPAFVRPTHWAAVRIAKKSGLSVERASTIARLAGIGSEVSR